MEDDKKGVSFGFLKKRDSKKLVNAAIKDEDHVKSDETDFLKSVEGKDLKSVKPKEKVKELVIPLIKENRWKVKETGDATTDLAVTELLQEAARQQESDQQDQDDGLTVPLLMKNKVPEGFEEDDNFDVSLRPDQATVPDYDTVPIEQYGMAMLRGMGWKHGEGIGRNKQVVKPIDAVARPKGLGLGANRSQASQKTSQNSGDREKKEQLILQKGAFCLVLSGKHKDFYGIVEGIDEDNARLMVKLAVEHQCITLSQMAMKLVSKTEYSKYSKYINKTKADKYKESERRRNERHREETSTESEHRNTDRHRAEERRKYDEHRDSSDTSSRRQRDGVSRVSHNERDTSSKRDRDGVSRVNHNEKDLKRKHKEHRSDRHKSHKQKIAKQELLSWLRPHLKVRIVDAEYKKGKHFKTKVVIEDVVSHDSCICRTEEGRVLEGLSQRMLETVIPKMDRAHVMIVNGKLSGQVAEILERDKSASTATLQLLSDRDHLISLSYDAICEYTGDVSLDFDY